MATRVQELVPGDDLRNRWRWDIPAEAHQDKPKRAGEPKSEEVQTYGVSLTTFGALGLVSWFHTGGAGVGFANCSLKDFCRRSLYGSMNNTNNNSTKPCHWHQT